MLLASFSDQTVPSFLEMCTGPRIVDRDRIVVNKSTFSVIRYRGIFTGVASSLLARGSSVVMSLLAVNMTLPYLGVEQFAAWAAIIALQIWLQLSDLGLPAGINNSLAMRLSKNDSLEARRLIFTSIVFILLTGVILFSVCTLLVLNTDISNLIKISSDQHKEEFDLALLAGIGLTLLSMPNTVIAKVYAAQHRAHVSNIWLSIGQIAAIGAMALCAQWQLSILWLTALTTGTVTLSALCCTFTFYNSQPEYRPKRGDFAPRVLRPIRQICASSSFLQLAGMVLLNSAIFIVTAALSPSATVAFVATSRLAGVCTLFAQLASPYFWASYSDAIVRDEHNWLKRAFRNHIAVSIGSTLALGVLLGIFGLEIIAWWTAGAVAPDQSLLLWLLTWQLVIAIMSPMGSLLNAYEMYRVQAILSLLAGAIGGAVGYAFAPYYGASGVIAATTLTYALIVVVPVFYQINKLLVVP